MLSEIAFALASTNDKYYFYLDLQTGAVVKCTETIDGMNMRRMLPAIAQEYVSRMLGVYLEDETTDFDTHSIGNNFLVWMELEKLGIVTINEDRTLAILDPDAVTRVVYPDDEFD